MTALASQLVLLPPHVFLAWLFWHAQPQLRVGIRLAIIAAAVLAWMLGFSVVLQLAAGYGLIWTLIATTIAGYLAFTGALAVGYEVSRR